jgi:hypothetical protein
MDLSSTAQALLSWISNAGFKIVLIALGAFILHKYSRVFIEKGIRKLVKSDRMQSPEEENKRENTLIAIFIKHSASSCGRLQVL